MEILALIASLLSFSYQDCLNNYYILSNEELIVLGCDVERIEQDLIDKLLEDVE